MATHARRRRPIPAEPALPVHGESARPPSQEAIAARAYALFLARGGGHGDDWADWLRAEAELRAEGTPTSDQSEP